MTAKRATPSTPDIEPAELEWRHDAETQREAPFSTRYDDVYFSRHDGREETRFVFLQHNRVEERLREWHETRPFVIGETGFGTGLNMLCAWECFDRVAAAGARLHLVSTEKHPLHREALERAWSAWPELATRARVIIEQWPAPVAGIHRLRLAPDVTLDLHFGDAADCLAQLDGRVDAWFLDGFAPAKNPDMWRPPLFSAMAAASRPGTTFATFTCAGSVRRGLAEAGFVWRKVPGFGRKREMLCGEWDATESLPRRAATPWFQPPAPRPTAHVAVIGAGVAGCSVAEALARRGSRVSLIDRSGVASGASGNPQAALYVKLAVERNRQSRFYLAALLHTLRWLAWLDPERRWWSDCGLLALAGDARGSERQQRFLDNYALPAELVAACDASEATRASGIETEGGLFYPQAGWVDPVALCQQLAATPGIEWHHHELRSLCESESGWRLGLDETSLVVDQVVFATGHASRDWLDGLPLQSIRGQVSTLHAASLTLPRQVLCASGYVMPPRHGTLTFGATYAPNDASSDLRQADHRRNLEELACTAPALSKALGPLAPEALGGRASVRAASPDKTPYAGPLPDTRRWHHDYAALRRDARRRIEAPGKCHPGLWVSAAHGSRGMVSAPLCAELIASRLHDEPMPLPESLVDHLHPGRRIIADLIRGH